MKFLARLINFGFVGPSSLLDRRKVSDISNGGNTQLAFVPVTQVAWDQNITIAQKDTGSPLDIQVATLVGTALGRICRREGMAIPPEALGLGRRSNGERIH